MKLSNGARLEVVFVVQYTQGMKPHGICLAETETDWVTWNIFWDGVTSNPNLPSCEEVWECEGGHYYQKGSDAGAARLQAEKDFGKRLGYIISMGAYQGLREACEP